MRERLVELLMQTEVFVDDYAADIVAGHLLASGVILPPSPEEEQGEDEDI